MLGEAVLGEVAVCVGEAVVVRSCVGEEAISWG